MRGQPHLSPQAESHRLPAVTAVPPRQEGAIPSDWLSHARPSNKKEKDRYFTGVLGQTPREAKGSATAADVTSTRQVPTVE